MCFWLKLLPSLPFLDFRFDYDKTKIKLGKTEDSFRNSFDIYPNQLAFRAINEE